MEDGCGGRVGSNEGGSKKVRNRSPLMLLSVPVRM